jgi:hypothetical protein
MRALRLCRACGGFHDLGSAWPRACANQDENRRSRLAAPAVRPDGMATIRSMADGALYDSRSRYEASVRRSGCQIVGEDRSGFGRRRTADDLLPHSISADIRRAIEELSSR